MKTSRVIRAALLLLLTYNIQCAASSIPPGVSTSLTGEKVEFPKDLHGSISFLIVGFSQKSADQATEWGKAIDGLGTCQGQHLTWFQLPVLASAPGFLRPLILRSMRSGLTRAVQQHFVPITDHEADWKVAAGYQATDAQKDDAYILAADEKGQVVAKWHGSRQSSGEILQETFRHYCPSH
jgi:hypothetical protein